MQARGEGERRGGVRACAVPAPAGHPAPACTQCRGAGQVTTQRGFIIFSTTCPRCRGTGETIADPCASCTGTGTSAPAPRCWSRSRPVSIADSACASPSGMPGRLEPRRALVRGREPGADERFERNGYDLAIRECVSFVDAAVAGSQYRATDGTRSPWDQGWAPSRNGAHPSRARV